MANDPWADFRTGPAPTAPAREDPILSGPDPFKQKAEVRADRGDERADTSLGVTLRNEKRGIEEKDFSQAKSLRDEFSKSPDVQKYKTIVGQFAAGVSAGDNTAGDQKLINAYAQMLNPTSTVMLGEYQATAEVDSAIQRAKTKIMREVGWDGVGRLSPEGRKKVLSEMSLLEKETGKVFNQQWNYYAEQAKRNGFDPFDVVGPHARDPYQTTFQKYDEDRRARGELNDGGPMAPGAPAGGQPGPNGGVTNPEMRGGLPVGTDVTFGKQEPDWWDRDKALKEKFGVTPDQEQLITAFWNQNGDTASPQAIKQWYSSQGLPVPTDEAIRQGIEHGRKGGDFGSFDLSAEKAAYENQIKVNLDGQGFDPNSVGAYADRPMQGILQGMGDELSGVIGGAKALVNNEGVASGYTQARDTARYALDQEAQAQGFTGNALEFAGNLATGMKAPGGPVRSGATAGAIAGFGYGDGAQGSASNALFAAAVGAGGGYAVNKAAPYIGRGVNAIRQRGNASIRNALAPEARQTLEAFDRQGATPRRPDLIPAERGRVGAVQQTEGGRPIIDAAYADDLANAEAGVAAIGGRGTPQDKIGLGTRIQSALERHGKATKDAASVRYARAEKMAGNPQIVPQNGIAKAAEIVASLQGNGNTNAAEIKFLTGLGEDLSAPGGKTIQQIRDLRTSLRGQIKSQNLDATKAEANAMEILDAASKDIEGALGSNNLALAEYKAGDKIYRERAQFRKQITQRLLGPKDNPFSPERTASAIDEMMKPGGDFGRFKRVIDVMDDGERADLAASVTSNLGRDANGKFSFKLFMNAVDGKNPAALRLVLGDDGFKALKDWRVITQAKHEAQSARNTSNTGGVVSRMGGGLKDLLWGAMAYSSAGPAGGVVAQAGSNLFRKLGDARTARLLMNPKFTNAIRQAPQTSNPKAIDAYFGRLVKSVSATPQAANDVDAFVGALRESFVRSPERAAADEKQN